MHRLHTCRNYWPKRKQKGLCKQEQETHMRLDISQTLEVHDTYLRTRRKPRKLLDPNLKKTNRKVVSIFKKMELKIPNIDFYLVLSLSRVHKKKKKLKKN